MTIEFAGEVKKTKPVTAFNKSNSKTQNTDKRVSVCSDCRAGIFTFHITVWTNRGLVHDYCDRGDNEIKKHT